MEPQQVTIKLTPEMVRQIDLVEDPPQKIYQLHGDKFLRFLRKENLSPYEFCCIASHLLLSISQTDAPHLYPAVRLLNATLYQQHYAEAAIRLGLSKPLTQEELNGIQTERTDHSEDESDPRHDGNSDGVEPQRTESKLLDADGNPF